MKVLLDSERTVCYYCLLRLEPSRYTNFVDNEIAHIFEGSIRLHYATAGFRYYKEGILQQLIFKLKYHYHKEIGAILGKQMGYALKNTPFETVDYLIPVPLHPKKYRIRGYNQSEWIAKGLAEVLKKKVDTTTLRRIVHTDSQTYKSRMQRFENIEGAFDVGTIGKVKGKHVLLIDDVVTTGGTLIACANALQSSDDSLKISIACLAKADEV